MGYIRNGPLSGINHDKPCCIDLINPIWIDLGIPNFETTRQAERMCVGANEGTFGSASVAWYPWLSSLQARVRSPICNLPQVSEMRCWKLLNKQMHLPRQTKPPISKSDLAVIQIHHATSLQTASHHFTSHLIHCTVRTVYHSLIRWCGLPSLTLPAHTRTHHPL